MRSHFTTLLFFLGSFSQAQKVALVDIDSVINAMPETKIAMQKLDSALAAYQKRLDIMSDSLEWIGKNMPHGRNKSPEEIQRVNEYMEGMKNFKERIVELKKNAEKDLENYRLALHAPIEKSAKILSIEVCKKNKYAGLVESWKHAAILYCETQPMDITSLVIQAVKK